jgi:hypothetical protein
VQIVVCAGPQVAESWRMGLLFLSSEEEDMCVCGRNVGFCVFDSELGRRQATREIRGCWMSLWVMSVVLVVG